MRKPSPRPLTASSTASAWRSVSSRSRGGQSQRVGVVDVDRDDLGRAAALHLERPEAVPRADVEAALAGQVARAAAPSTTAARVSNQPGVTSPGASSIEWYHSVNARRSRPRARCSRGRRRRATARRRTRRRGSPRARPAEVVRSDSARTFASFHAPRALGGLRVAAQRGADARDLVGGDRGARAGPAADDALVGAARRRRRAPRPRSPTPSPGARRRPARRGARARGRVRAAARRRRRRRRSARRWRRRSACAAILWTRMRRLAARGVVINGAFDVALTSLGLLRGFVVAAFLTHDRVRDVRRARRGARHAAVAQAGRRRRQVRPAAATTTRSGRSSSRSRSSSLLCGFFFLLVLAVVPLMVWVYGEPQLLAPGPGLLAGDRRRGAADADLAVLPLDGLPAPAHAAGGRPDRRASS